MKMVCRIRAEVGQQKQTFFFFFENNGKLLHHDTQNEILEIAASLIKKIKSDLHDEPGTYYAILADECKDLSKRELVAVCIRYLHNRALRERAVGFVETGNTTAEAIS